MSLSAILLIISPLFALPLLLLPNNKVRIFSFSLLIGFGFILTLNIFNSINNNFGYSIGKGIYPLYAWFIDGNIELSKVERYHTSFVFTQAIIYLVLVISFYTLFNAFYIGKNPSIEKHKGKFLNIFLKIVIYLLSFATISYFLISIRYLTCMEDGFMSGLFNLIYKVGA